MSGFRKAAKPLVRAAQSGAPRGDDRKGKGKFHAGGNLRRSMGTVELPEEVAMLVGAKLSGANKGWYAHFIEGGTKERFRKSKTGTGATGKMTANPFFERAFDATQEQMYESIEEEWYNAIDKFIIKTNKKLK